MDRLYPSDLAALVDRVATLSADLIGPAADDVDVNAAWPEAGMRALAAERPATGLQLFARVNNVLDRRYETYAAAGSTVFDAQGAYTGE